MKKLKIASVFALLTIIALVIVRYNLLSTAEEPTMPTAIHVEKDREFPMGTEENPFTIVEIVPHESMAEFGYMISGCEPIDMEGLAINNTLASQYNTKIVGAKVATKGKDISYYKMPEEVEPGSTISSLDTNKYNEYMQVDWNKGNLIMNSEDYIINNSTSYGVWTWQGGGKTFTGYYEKVESGEGWFVKETVADVTSFKYVGRGNGDYRWVTAENVNNVPTDYAANQVWSERTPAVYYEYKKYNFQHNHDLMEALFEDEDPANIVSQVIVVTPYDFMNPENLALIEKADLLYLHRAHDSGGMFDMWVGLNKEGETLKDKYGKEITAQQAKAMTFDDNDLPWPAVMAIVDRMSGENPAGLIMDEAVYNTKSNKRNTHKLVLILKQYGPKVFKELYLSATSNPKVVESTPQDDMDGLTTGVFVKDENTKITEWTKDTFVPDPKLDTLGKYEYGMLNPDVNGQHPLTGQSMWSEVRDNMYFYVGDKGFLDDFLNESLSESAANAEAFDYFEDKDTIRPGGLSGKDIIEYLLQGFSKKRKLKILEVQPCDTFIYGSENWKLYYMSMFSWFEGNIDKDVEVVTMATREFISSIEDLNSEYDAIIFGVNQDASNGKVLVGTGDTPPNVPYDKVDEVEIDGKKVKHYYRYYVDDAMNNSKGSLAYTTIGDYVSTGLVSKKDEYGNDVKDYTLVDRGDTTGRRAIRSDKSMRYSGTDITEKKLKELKEYLNAGKPIILDRSCVNRDSGGTTPNANLIDTSSYMYQLVDMYQEKIEGVATENIFVRGLYQTNKLKRVLAYETCRIELDTTSGTGCPAEYTYETAEDNTISNVTYSSRVFQYRFKIVGKTGQKYAINLYIDVNGDGVYEDSLSTKDYNIGETDSPEGTESSEETESPEDIAESEKVSGIIVRDRNGQVVNPNELHANVTYTLTKELESNYQGIIPWKLEANKGDNDYCRNSIVKYSAIESSTGKKEKINVLLMNLTPDMTERKEYDKEKGQRVREFINMADTNTDNGKKFKKYIDCVAEYDVSLTFLENADWMAMFDPYKQGFNSNAIQKNASQIAAWKQYLDGYDMLILGFNDDCTYTNNYIYNEGFKYFVECGKSAILSHDMVRDTTSVYPFLTNFDEQLRQLMAQRRYFTNKIMRNGEELSLLAENTSKFTVDINNGTEDIAVPGNVDNATRLYVVFGDQAQSDRDAWTKGGSWGNGEATTTYVSIINKGQITNYPYKINDIIKVATTHGQNFQLNMENEELVVWYGLTDKYSEQYTEEVKAYEGKNFSVASNKLGRGIYSSIEGDGRNSFYIYNVGNITYTGLGHLGNMTDEEVQLFVNTMISAYRRTAAAPKVEVTNEDAIINGDDATLYITLDDSNFNTDSEYLDVYFKVVDPSMVTIAGRSYVLQYKDKDGNVLAETTYAKNTNAKVADNAESALVVVDGEYYFKVPYSKVRNDGIAEYELVLKSSYVNNENVTVETENSKKVYIMPMPLFTLN